MSLSRFGWSASFEEAFAAHGSAGHFPARVAREDAGRYLLLDDTGERTAELAGRLRHTAEVHAELPAVGDWVAVRRESSGPSLITAVLPRMSAFTRKVAGDETKEQVVAANIDTVFLVSGLDNDFNPRRIERYLTATWESGATPVVVLNKADLATDLERARDEVEAIAAGVPVVSVSALEGDGLEALSPWLASGKTVALLGSSGVGKSTLVNALLGEERQSTGAIRVNDSRGRHTTTRRELVLLPGGAILVDTPGMRELQLWGEGESLGSAFPDVVLLAAECRFRDCEHRSEPGCAVLGAVERGDLDGDRLAAWRKLQNELAYLVRRQDARARAAEQAKWKARTKSMRLHPKAARWR